MVSIDLSRVPGRSHYSLDYLRSGRLFSYAQQIDSVIRLSAKSVLEVGPGPGLVTSALRTAGVRVTTVDIQSEVRPDVLASVLDLPFGKGEFDVSMCCQVLEHLPFSVFEPAVSELWRVCKLGLLISLPDVTPYYEVRLRLPRINRVWIGTRRKVASEEQIRQTLELNGHYWEIGHPDVSHTRVREVMQRLTGCTCRSWRVSEMPYHRFYLINKGEHEHR